MESLMGYLFKLVLISGFLTTYYWFFLRNRKFNHYNRFYLLVSVIISLVGPLVNFQMYQLPSAHDEITDGFISIMSGSGTGEPSFFHHWESVLFWLVGCISMSLKIILLARIYSVYSLRRKLVCTPTDGILLIETEMPQAPFSFFNMLFWKKGTDRNSEIGQMIFTHELTHIREKHSYDKIFMQAVTSLFWMNPFFWLIRKELNLIHEFVADQQSVRDGGTYEFARMLLASQNHGAYLDPVHSFFHSPIKRRIMMVANSRPVKYSYLRKLLVLPVTMLILFMLSYTVSSAQSHRHDKDDTAKNQKVLTEHDTNVFDKYHPEEKSASEAETRELITKILKDPPATRVYFINGERSSAEKVKKLKYEKLSDILMLPADEALNKYGVTGEKGIVDFTLKHLK
jgi:hypothetical protein